MNQHLLILALGLLLLTAGAEALVRGASRLAITLGVSPLVIGLTVVAYGTSTPEMAVSAMSGFGGESDIALGNVVGSNIFNVLFILGISALIAPLGVSQQLVRIDVPLMIAVSILLLLLAIDDRISRLDGALLFAGVITYTTFLIVKSRKENHAAQGDFEREYGGHPATTLPAWLINAGLVVGGILLLVVGARWLVESAVTIAQLLGISELIIGLTIVAVGTSLPELATSVVASIRGERDIAVGNIVGSNIFNILSVLGLSAIIAPEGITVSAAALSFDIPVMIAVAVACFPLFFSGYTITRWKGALFLGYYLAYTLYILMTATQHDALPLFNMAMLWFVLPLTAITLIVITYRARH